VDEQTAIRRLKRGDIGGLAVLVERYEVQAVRTAYLITQDRALAEDVVQSTFLQIYQRIDQFDDGRPFAPWFMRSVINAALQAIQRQKRELSLDTPLAEGGDGATFADLLPDPAPGPDGEIEQAELRALIWDALQQLTPDQRAAVVMRYYLDYSDGEISDETDSPPGTVRWRLHAARKQLRGILRRFAAGESARGWQEGV
jgi:RNA polymerase sigma-70 factor (ECF subfamily)